MNRKFNAPGTTIVVRGSDCGIRFLGLGLVVGGLMVLASLLIASPAHAIPIQIYAVQDGRSEISIHQAVKRVKQRQKGRVLGAHTENKEGRSVHVIKMVTDKGLIRHIQVDAQTGAIR